MDFTTLIKAYDVRGVVPDPFSEAVARAIGTAFAQCVVLPDHTGDDHPSVVVGRDMRATGPMLVAAFAAGLRDCGVDVLDMGLTSTDGLYFASGSRQAHGAMFTASHNPAEYNGIKLCRPGARPVGSETGLAEIRAAAEQILTDGVGTRATSVERHGELHAVDLMPEYAQCLRTLVDLSGIRRLKVVVDAGSGMAGHTVPRVLGDAAGLSALPLDIVPLYFELDGSFPFHEANPLDPKNLVDLQNAVREHEADLGLAFDGDADRCFVVDESGAVVSPSAITALVGMREIRSEKAAGRPTPAIIVNHLTSRAVPAALETAGARTVRTRVGHSYIKPVMADEDAVFGGEHSAHYYFRDFWFADSGMLAALHVMAELGGQERPLSELAARYSPYVASGEINRRVPDAPTVVAAVVEHFQESGPVDVERFDGVTVSSWGEGTRGWWFNLRSSNTEPLLRLNVEAIDDATMAEVRDRVLEIIDRT
ncbi:phosphomannomutase/phosphoglucomutase [Brevibacterium litoralis]|uniref:phosphomannomutase/phosphoglucomutase n=1 Tax=Brevibacterium litoralis TaxID=3138935 RepID=UPI0032ECB39D